MRQAGFGWHERHRGRPRIREGREVHRWQEQNVEGGEEAEVGVQGRRVLLD